MALFGLILSMSTLPLLADSSLFKEGESYFLHNKPDKAVGLLEEAVKTDPGNFKLYLYLGISYEQLKLYEKAVDTYLKGISSSTEHKDILYANLGNNYIRLGESKKAVEAFTKALSLNGTNTSALRNRAGEYLRLGNYGKALADYKLYLTLEPEAYQKDDIQKVISLLQGKLDDIAKQKLAAEQKKLAEEKKQQELLNKVLNSLSKASEDTTNLSAGASKVEQYSDGFDIVE